MKEVEFRKEFNVFTKSLSRHPLNIQCACWHIHIPRYCLCQLQCRWSPYIVLPCIKFHVNILYMLMNFSQSGICTDDAVLSKSQQMDHTRNIPPGELKARARARLRYIKTKMTCGEVHMNSCSRGLFCCSCFSKVFFLSTTKKYFHMTKELKLSADHTSLKIKLLKIQQYVHIHCLCLHVYL